eukprot:scaffold16264_cov75-Skeletonema_dohrnii-CCMP3373.AAC.1
MNGERSVGAGRERAATRENTIDNTTIQKKGSSLHRSAKLDSGKARAAECIKIFAHQNFIVLVVLVN